MKVHAFSDLDLDIARTRIVLSLLAMLSLYVDPTTAGGLFHLTPTCSGLCFVTSHTVSATYFLLQSEIAKRWLPTATTLLDLLFAMAIAYLTEGQTVLLMFFSCSRLSRSGFARPRARSSTSRCWEWQPTWR